MLLFRMHNIRIPLLSVLICFLIVLCLPLQSSSAVIEGIILSEKGPLVNGEVFAYESYDELINKHPSHTSVAGDKKGFYLLDLPAGRYYLTASGIERGNSFFAFHGANPITVTDENLWIPFMVLPETDETIAGTSSAKLSGKVTFKGSPVQGAQVSIYPVTNMAFRGMGFLTSTTDMHGLFALNAEPGEYVIVARKRMNFRGLRPLVKGDLF